MKSKKIVTKSCHVNKIDLRAYQYDMATSKILAKNVLHSTKTAVTSLPRLYLDILSRDKNDFFHKQTPLAITLQKHEERYCGCVKRFVDHESFFKERIII